MMTREEAIEYAESKKMRLEALVYNDDCKYGNYAMYSGELSFVNAALSALRPVSREQVEKAWRGEWMALDECSNEGVYCKRCKKKVYRIEYANEKMRSPFCPACGAAQTDEAVEIVMERLEALESDARGTI